MKNTSKYYSDLKVKNLKGSEVEIEASLPVEIIEKHHARILEEMRKDFAAPGFRKGNVPMNLFMQNVNEILVLQEAAELALNEAYPEIVKDEDIKVFGRPRITLTKLVPKNPVEFKINVGVVPEVKLPDYKKIAKKITDEKESIIVTEAEIEEVLSQIKKMRSTKDDGTKVEAATAAADQELTDEFVKTLGNFAGVDDFKAKVTENMRREKEGAAGKKRREMILKHLVDNAKVELPAIIVEDEARAIADRFETSLVEKNLTKEEYLKKIGKTEEDIRKDDLAHVENELKVRLILDKIAELENIKVEEAEVEAEMEFMQSRHPEADPEHLRVYIESILRNEKLLRLLEGAPEVKKAEHDESHAGHDHEDHAGHSH